MNKMHKGVEVIEFSEQNQFYQWLSLNYNSRDTIWVRFFKKGSNVKCITIGEAVEVALCWGWIDGLLNKFDDLSYVVRFTPRRKKSVWSKINVEKVDKLIQAGMMQEPGLKQVEAAKADGRWEKAYAGQSQMEIPDDFILALKQDETALETYEKMSRSGKYVIFYRLNGVADGDKRSLKIAKLIAKIKSDPAAFGVK
ncbi:MAG: YdeI/OmpD-associated family protein [Patescibacteria group bacterium]